MEREPADQGLHAMDKQDRTSTAGAELRRKTGGKVASQSAVAGACSSDVDAKRLLHELQVHQVELEAQNTELQLSQHNLELLLEQYTTLFDFAPAGYVTLDRDGRILNINLAGAGLVGTTRTRSNKQFFARFVAEEDQALFTDFLERVFSEQAGKTTCELRLVKGGRARLFVPGKIRLMCP